MDLDLARPLHVDDETWAAIDSYRRRLGLAVGADDRPLVVGGAKELVESIARSVLAATGETLGDNAKFGGLVDAAHKALKRQGGQGVSPSEEIRAIANSARAIVVSVAPIRNAVGTGHGRSRVDPIDDETMTVVVDAAMLWCRWALRRLGHLLGRYPTLLIEELNSGSSRSGLQSAFDAVYLGTQPPDIQHTLGVVFGQSAAGGYGNAFAVAVRPAAETGLDDFPIDYRLGLVEGMFLTPAGQIGLTAWYVPEFVKILAPVPSRTAEAALSDLAARAEDASWIPRLRMSTVDPHEAIEALKLERTQLGSDLEGSLDGLIKAIDPSSPSRQP